MADLTIQDLCRLSHMPDNPGNPAEQIAGQKYYDVEFTGGSITGITPSGLPTPLAIADGGTGQITANAALNALLPTQVGQSGKVLLTNGTDVAWQPTGATGITQLTGDVTAGPGSGSVAATLATVNSNVGTFGSATQASQVTVNAKGLVTAAANVTVTPAATALTGAAALTKVDDTNVTLTLGGTPATSLLRATSITVGWTGLLAASRGGTANGFTQFSGPATSAKTFALPNANATILTDSNVVTVAQGGTSLSTLTTGNVILGAGTSSPTFVAPGTSGNVLTSNGSTWTSVAQNFPLSFTSTDQTITASGGLTLAHGLGATPKLVQYRLVCQSNDNGYTTGQILDALLCTNPQTERIFSAEVDATNIIIRYGIATNVFQSVPAGGGSSTQLTNANWKLRIFAWV